jgi:hypothetical protein
MAALLRAAAARGARLVPCAPARAFRLKPGQVGTEVHELLPAGLAPPSAVKPPFTPASAHAKLAQLAAAWNTADPARIAALYAPGAARVRRHRGAPRR